ncbi:hypothetical protein [Streptomyces litchfieldiae]|uniref:Uncharacterized protein n=1 Tax=Streptomyces litchfieldiae TaxID=3075543 RepID=A0ABU2MKQ1_9ACTN|nr:hypothetical protein [Streptomyces sp. DSM 44938]MDT0342183.1 hypothetical protein [Streptomyces sp. DSM 44938]
MREGVLEFGRADGLDVRAEVFGTLLIIRREAVTTWPAAGARAVGAPLGMPRDRFGVTWVVDILSEYRAS